MQDSWVLVTLTLIFGLLPSLQGVSTNETVNTCGILNCPKGFRCCDNKCCLDRKVWDPANKPFRIVFIIIWVMLPLFFICGLVRHFCLKCRELQHEVQTVDQQTPPELYSIAPLERIWFTSLGSPPPYFEVVLMPAPTEPPPPYSLRPEGPAVQMRGTGYATL
ncbi:transmembrane protein 92-like isoform X1 [Arvicanthis niloticus]|uniref:transmembrane protein 92-like isoform X1 n=1 Tax=Arvicanthis niloticus TaxID=61156 RepID=UPI0014871280|nr:transmembrane protein 92-like [Arvicanthis niloticus]